MPSNFPGAIDSFTDPLSNSSLASPSHSTLHSDINDAVEKVEQYMGLVKVIPTSVTSAGGTAATLNATTGTVTIGNGNTSVTVINAFSSMYQSYRLTIANFQTSTACDLRFQLDGVTTGVYNYSFLYGDTASTTVANSRASSQTFCVVGNGDTGNANSSSFDVHGPQTATRTAITGTVFGANVNGLIGCQIVDTAQRTGFVLTLSGGSFSSGTIRVYGYRN